MKNVLLMEFEKKLITDFIKYCYMKNYKKPFEAYKEDFRDVIFDNVELLTKYEADRLRAQIADVYPDRRFEMYSTNIPYTKLLQTIYQIYLHRIYNIVTWGGYL